MPQYIGILMGEQQPYWNDLRHNSTSNTGRPISFLNRSIERKLIYILNSSLHQISWEILALWLEKYKSTLVPELITWECPLLLHSFFFFFKWFITLPYKSWDTVEDEAVGIQPEISDEHWFDHQDFQQRWKHSDSTQINMLNTVHLWLPWPCKIKVVH